MHDAIFQLGASAFVNKSHADVSRLLAADVGAARGDPGQLKCWFTSADKCQRALSEVVAELARDGTSAKRLGFRALIVAWGL